MLTIGASFKKKKKRKSDISHSTSKFIETPREGAESLEPASLEEILKENQAR